MVVPKQSMRPQKFPGSFWPKETRMESNIKLGRLFGVEIGLHYTWIIIALLIAFSLAARFQTMHPDWGGGVAWLTAIITAALFFASIIVHELSHAMVAKMRGLPGAFDHAVCPRRRGEDREGSRRRKDRILDGHSRPDHQRRGRIHLSWLGSDARLGVPGRAGHAADGDARLARLHQYCDRYLQYDSRLPDGRRAGAARGGLVEDRRYGACHARGGHDGAGRRLRIHRPGRHRLLPRPGLRRIVDRLHRLVPAQRGSRQLCARRDGRKTARSAGCRLDGARLRPGRWPHESANVRGRIPAGHGAPLSPDREERRYGWTHYAARGQSGRARAVAIHDRL